MKVTRNDVAYEVVTDGPASHLDFWQRYSSGSWEPETFRIFDAALGPDVTHVDFGAWIGPTALYAAHRAARVYAFEPDPVAFEALTRNLACNPHLAQVEVANVAIALEPGTLRIGVHGEAGDSESSVLRGACGHAWEVPAIRLDDFLRERGVTGRVFVKMDVEGYEYELLPDLLHALEPWDYLLYVATHPGLLSRGVPGTSWSAKLARRRASVMPNLRLMRALYRLPYLAGPDWRPLDPFGALWRIVRHGGSLAPVDAVLVTNRPACWACIAARG